MSLEDIKKKIISDALKQKEEIIKLAEEKRNQIISNYVNKFKEYKEAQIEKTKSEGESLKKGIIIKNKLKSKNEILRKKREFLDEVYKEAMNRLINSVEYKELFTKLVLKFSETHDEDIIVSKNEEVLNKNWIEEINKKNNFNLKYFYSDSNIKGGIIIRNGNSFINLSLDTMIDSIKENIEKDLATILFSDN